MSSEKGGWSAQSPVRPPKQLAPLQPVNLPSGHWEATMGRNLEERALELQRKVEELEERVQGGRRPIISPVPERPTDEEVRKHYTTHAPPKNWCPYCAKGRSTNDPHRKQRKERNAKDGGECRRQKSAGGKKKGKRAYPFRSNICSFKMANLIARI